MIPQPRVSEKEHGEFGVPRWDARLRGAARARLGRRLAAKVVYPDLPCTGPLTFVVLQRAATSRSAAAAWEILRLAEKPLKTM